MPQTVIINSSNVAQKCLFAKSLCLILGLIYQVFTQTIKLSIVVPY